MIIAAEVQTDWEFPDAGFPVVRFTVRFLGPDAERCATRFHNLMNSADRRQRKRAGMMLARAKRNAEEYVE